MLTLQDRKQKLVREAIWDAAIDLFSREGYEETTVDAIAEAAGVSRRSFFRYFSSKSDLMAYGVVSYGDELMGAIEACPPGMPESEVFRATVRRVAHHLASQNSEAQARTRKIMQIAEKYPAALEVQLARLAEVQKRVTGAFARRGGKTPGEDDVTAEVLGALTLSVLSLTFRLWFHKGQKDASKTADEVLAGMERVICGYDGGGKPARGNSF